MQVRQVRGGVYTYVLSQNKIFGTRRSARLACKRGVGNSPVGEHGARGLNDCLSKFLTPTEEGIYPTVIITNFHQNK